MSDNNNDPSTEKEKTNTASTGELSSEVFDSCS